jgi:hypothetical protein
MFFISICIWCLFLCICLSFGSIFHIWEETCGLCLFEPGLLHFILPYGLNKTPLYTHTYTTIS